jgi:methylenetetrahydrofolate dehydrogenase (NADP+)/methenyltetrahydrofolate cyclohydrolase
MILSGKPVAEKILLETKERIKASGIVPGLAVVLVGNDEASRIYVGIKELRAQEIGMRFELRVFEKTVPESEIIDCINELNGRTDIHGIIVQLPLPVGLNTDRVIAAIDPTKDADGFLASQKNVTSTHGREKRLHFVPVFPEAMIELAKSSGVPFSGKQAVVFVNSERFGRAMTDALGREGIVAEYIFPDDMGTSRSAISQADFIFSAVGRPGVLFESMFKRGAVVIDGGISKQGEKVVGDVETPEGDADIFLSPVPGGVGPVTVACLLRRVVDLALEKKKTA